jgi:DNA polymerase III alpha subunit
MSTTFYKKILGPIENKSLPNGMYNDIVLTMKAIYTYREAADFIKSVLQERTKHDFVIVELIPNQDWVAQICQCLHKADCLDSYGNVKPDMKIAAIKALRQFTADNQKEEGFYPMGLADSKWAVENLERFLKFIQVNHRLPVEGICDYGLK